VRDGNAEDVRAAVVVKDQVEGWLSRRTASALLNGQGEKAAHTKARITPKSRGVVALERKSPPFA
jgi:hypothetical protein